MNSGKIKLLFLLLFFLHFNLLCAGEKDPLPEFLRTRTELGSGYVFSSGLGSGRAEVSILSKNVSLFWRGVALNYGLENYSWRKPEETGFARSGYDPWGVLQRFSVSMRGVYPLSDSSGTLLSGGIRMFTGFERQLRRSFGTGADLALMKKVTPVWTAGAGIAAGYHPVRTSFMPVLSLRYDAEKTPGISASIGLPATEIRYRISKQWRAAMGVSLSGGTFRLKDNSPVEPKGYFRYSEISPGIALNYISFNRLLEFSLSANLYVDRQWHIYNQDGSRVFSERPGRAGGLKVNVIRRF